MTRDVTAGALLIGAGNAWRGDDAAGLHLVQRLRRRLPGVRALELSGEAAELLEAWRESELVVVVDAVSSGAPAGTLHRFDATAEPLPARLLTRSTHGWGVAQAIELGRALGRLPRRLIVYGIEGQDFQFGQTLSPAVERALEEAVELVSRDLGQEILLETSTHRRQPTDRQGAACTSTRS